MSGRVDGCYLGSSFAMSGHPWQIERLALTDDESERLLKRLAELRASAGAS